MGKSVCALAFVLAATGNARAAIGASEAARLAAAAQVVHDIKLDIPQEYWSKARCVAVVPDLKKAAFIFGGEYGKGVMSCRSGERWSPPVFIQLAKVNLGVDASVAAGPIGRQGSVGTDAALTAEILSYSRAKGLFAGINLSGGVLRPDEDANAGAYGKGASPRTILASRDISAPTQAATFLRALEAQGIVSSASAERPAPTPTAPSVRTTTMPTTDDDLRTRIVDIEQMLDRILAETTPAPVGTSGTVGAAGNGTVTLDRSRLLQLRQQLDAVIALLNKR